MIGPHFAVSDLRRAASSIGVEVITVMAISSSLCLTVGCFRPRPAVPRPRTICWRGLGQAGRTRRLAETVQLTHVPAGISLPPGHARECRQRGSARVSFKNLRRESFMWLLKKPWSRDYQPAARGSRALPIPSAEERHTVVAQISTKLRKTRSLRGRAGV